MSSEVGAISFSRQCLVMHLTFPTTTSLCPLRVLGFTIKISDELPFALVDSTISALTYLARMKHISSIPTESLTFVLNHVLDSLLDQRVSQSSASVTMKANNKVKNIVRSFPCLADFNSISILFLLQLALRLVQSPPPDNSLCALLLLQKTALSNCEKSAQYSAKRARVIEKLVNKTIVSEHEKNPHNSFGAVNLNCILSSLSECLRAMKSIQIDDPGRKAELNNADNMTKLILIELLKSKKESVDESSQQLLNDCASSTLASLIQRVGKSDGDEQAAAIADLSALKDSIPDLFESHMLNLSIPFRAFITDKLNNYNNKKFDECSNTGSKKSTSVDPPTQLNDLSGTTSKDSFSNIRARIAALKQQSEVNKQ